MEEESGEETAIEFLSLVGVYGFVLIFSPLSMFSFLIRYQRKKHDKTPKTSTGALFQKFEVDIFMFPTIEKNSPI